MTFFLAVVFMIFCGDLPCLSGSVAVCDARRAEAYANYGGDTDHNAGGQKKRGQHTDTEGRERYVSPFAYLTAFHWLW